MIGQSVRVVAADDTVPISPGPVTGPPVAVASGPRVAPRPSAPALVDAPAPQAPSAALAPATVDAVRRDPEFRALRGRLRRFVFTVTPLFLAWYGLFVVLSAFAPSLMRIPVIGSVNIGMLLGLAQFASTLVIVALYGRFAAREIDPRVRELRENHERRGRRRDASADAQTEIWRMR